ncbi:ribonuclease H-like domain-containing protein [Tanacetum coccineum]
MRCILLKTFGGNEATKKTKKNLLKQQYGNFKAEGSKTLEQTFNRLQAIVSQLKFLDVPVEQEDLNHKFLTSFSPEWLMRTIVWRNINDLDTMSLNDLYNHLKVYESEVQKKGESSYQNMAFISSSNTNSGKSEIDDDDIEEMDIKWNMALLSMRADRFWKKTGKKITIQGSDVAGFDKSKVECFNCHKLGHFARECRAPRSQDRSRRESYKKEPKSFMAEENEASENQALVAEEVVPTEFALMAMSSSSLVNEVEARLVVFKINESKFCEKIRVLERDLELKDYKIENLTNELEEVKKERDGIDFKLEKFVNSSKDLDQMLESQKSGKDKKGVGFDEYRVVPPPPAQVYSSPMPDLSWTGLHEFADNTVTDYTRPTPSVDVTNDVRSELDGNNWTVCEHGRTSSNVVSKPIINFVKESGCPNVIKINNIENARKPTAKYAELYRNITQSSNVRSNNFGPPIIEDWDSEDESDTESTPIESIRSTNRDQPRGNQRNWNNLKSQQLGKDFVMQNKACYKCGSFEHLKVNCNKNKWVNKGKNWSRVNYTQGNLTPKSILLKSGTKTIAPNRSFSTARTSLNVAQPKMKSFVKSAHSNVKRPFERKALSKNKIWVPSVRTKNLTVGLKVPTAKPTVAAAKGNKGKAVKASAHWIWKPKQISGEGSNVNGVSGKPLDNIDDKGFWDSGGKITGKGTIKTGTKEDVKQAEKEKGSPLRFIALPNWFHEAQMITTNDAAKKSVNEEVLESSGISFPTASSKESSKLTSTPTMETAVPTISTHVPTVIKSRGGLRYSQPPSISNAVSSENRVEDFFGDSTHATRLNEVEADLSNMETTIQVSPTPTLRIHKDHPKNQIIGPADTPLCLFSAFLSQEEPKKISEAIKDSSWVEAMQEELLQFQIQNVWVLVDCPKGEEGIDYEEVFSPVARIEAIRLFLAYASYMGFTVYQMDVKSAFLYGTIDEEVYMMQPFGFQDPQFPHKVYKVVKAMYGLHQAPKAWYGTLSKYLLDNGFQRGTIDQNLFTRKHKGEFLLVHVYVDDIIFGSSNPKLCREFEVLMHDKFKMSAMGELSFFLGL